MFLGDWRKLHRFDHAECVREFVGSDHGLAPPGLAQLVLVEGLLLVLFSVRHHRQLVDGGRQFRVVFEKTRIAVPPFRRFCLLVKRGLEMVDLRRDRRLGVAACLPGRVVAQVVAVVRVHPKTLDRPPRQLHVCAAA